MMEHDWLLGRRGSGANRETYVSARPLFFFVLAETTGALPEFVRGRALGASHSSTPQFSMHAL
jgi:hypothetical protein